MEVVAVGAGDAVDGCCVDPRRWLPLVASLDGPDLSDDSVRSMT